MKNKINRAKQFAHDHRAKFIGAAGIVAGIAIGKNLPTEKTLAILDITADQAQQLIEDPSKCIEFATANSHILVVMKHT